MGPRPPVVLWPDTFNNYFFPGSAKSAVRVLEDAGYHVIVPEERLCCGRPLYDYGMLDLAASESVAITPDDCAPFASRHAKSVFTC